jgi:hypothetical protein
MGGAVSCRRAFGRCCSRWRLAGSLTQWHLVDGLFQSRENAVNPGSQSGKVSKMVNALFVTSQLHADGYLRLALDIL